MNNVLIATRPGDPNFLLFEKLPKLLYPENSSRFMLPDRINMDYIQSCYVLMQEDIPVARLALYKNPFLTYNGKNAFCLGNYECIDNPEAARTILNHAMQEAGKFGANFIIGPMNGSTWDNYRFCTRHDSPHFFLEPYHHLYYYGQFTACGLNVISKYFSSIDYDLHFDDPRVLQRARDLEKLGITLRNINMKDYRKELIKLYPFLLEAFKSNFLYTPISIDAFLSKYMESEKIIDPEFVILAEDIEKNLIGLFFCVKDIFNKEEKSMVVKTLARHPDSKWKGLGHVIGNEITKRCVQRGYSSMVHALIYEHGTSLELSRSYSGKIYKNYALYGKEL